MHALRSQRVRARAAEPDANQSASRGVRRRRSCSSTGKARRGFCLSIAGPVLSNLCISGHDALRNAGVFSALVDGTPVKRRGAIASAGPCFVIGF